MWNDFKKFISRGNVIDLAVGLAIGAAFGAIVKSLVSDIINPIVGLFIGSTDLSQYKYVLRKASENSKEISINYGSFILAVLNFFIIAFILFLIIRAYNKFKEELESITAKEEEKVEEEKVVKLSLQEELLTEIRNLLQEKNNK
ncbi:large-conductance mechanosensitive channel protein MscL [Oceanivirga miroungae]|uniref:Large-conductance mechanosensitive channel n=1 Tax=Oceanivirga miroungae TaxID=1130046 RepID=A0A6I8MC28_9FUSO|nr:large-conductance mechanosensitive channel protein MscL [Oceanivirga miroungae]VWL85773.1 large conductance mechanosensitive channel protein [Oceanivirga miroungae]